MSCVNGKHYKPWLDLGFHCFIKPIRGVQCLSGRVLDLRSWGCWFETLRRLFVVFLASLVLVQPRKRPNKTYILGCDINLELEKKKKKINKGIWIFMTNTVYITSVLDSWRMSQRILTTPWRNARSWREHYLLLKGNVLLSLSLSCISLSVQMDQN